MSAVRLSKLSLGQILAEVTRRKRIQAGLKRQRARLLKKLKAIEAQLDGKIRTAKRRGRKRRRASNKLTLPQAMGKVMSKAKALSVQQIAAAVKKVGYKSTSKSFTTIIHQTLAKNKQFKRAKRGQYVLKSG